MTRPAKIFLTICGLIIFAIIAYCVFIFVAVGYSMNRHMKIGKEYMDSLTDKDIQVWIQRTQKYLKEDNPRGITIGARTVPDELKQLGILRIDEQQDEVDYCWMGGFDHTELEVERMTNGSFQFTAEYSDESNRVIWPRQ